MSFLHSFRKNNSFSPSFSCRFPSFRRGFAYFFLTFCKKIEKHLAFPAPIVYTINNHTSVDVCRRTTARFHIAVLPKEKISQVGSRTNRRTVNR